MTTARSRAIAAESREIDVSTQRAIAAREVEQGHVRKMSALESMALRLNVSTTSLQETLMQTAFKGCSKAEFVALVIVSNTYDLNPLLRQIYAFPKKGGGIQAIVGYDGWIKIANDHPQFDGIEFEHIEDSAGNLKAVEGILYRKDRGHPTKKLVYLKEFKRNTEPWNNSPHHMLDVRCFCQTVRLGLGIPLGIEGEDNIDADVGSVRSQPVILPSRDEPAAEETETIDPETGEVLETDARGMTEVDEDTARALDEATVDDPHRARAEEMAARIEADFGKCKTDERRRACHAHYRDAIEKLEDAYPDLYEAIAPLIPAAEANDGTFDPQDNPSAAECLADEQRGEAHGDDDPVTKAVNGIRGSIAAAKNLNALGRIETDWTNKVMNGVADDALVRQVDSEFAAKRRELKQAEG